MWIDLICWRGSAVYRGQERSTVGVVGLDMPRVRYPTLGVRLVKRSKSTWISAVGGAFFNTKRYAEAVAGHTAGPQFRGDLWGLRLVKRERRG